MVNYQSEMSNVRVPHPISSRMITGNTYCKRPGGVFLCNIALLSRLKRVTGFLYRIKAFHICRLRPDEHVFRGTGVRQRSRMIHTWPHCLTLSHNSDTQPWCFPFADMRSGAWPEHHSSSPYLYQASARPRHRAAEQSKALKKEMQKQRSREWQTWGWILGKWDRTT